MRAGLAECEWPQQWAPARSSLGPRELGSEWGAGEASVQVQHPHEGGVLLTDWTPRAPASQPAGDLPALISVVRIHQMPPPEGAFRPTCLHAHGTASCHTEKDAVVRSTGRAQGLSTSNRFLYCGAVSLCCAVCVGPAEGRPLLPNPFDCIASLPVGFWPHVCKPHSRTCLSVWSTCIVVAWGAC